MRQRQPMYLNSRLLCIIAFNLFVMTAGFAFGHLDGHIVRAASAVLQAMPAAQFSLLAE